MSHVNPETHIMWGTVSCCTRLEENMFYSFVILKIYHGQTHRLGKSVTRRTVNVWVDFLFSAVFFSVCICGEKTFMVQVYTTTDGKCWSGGQARVGQARELELMEIRFMTGKVPESSFGETAWVWRHFSFSELIGCIILKFASLAGCE